MGNVSTYLAKTLILFHKVLYASKVWMFWHFTGQVLPRLIIYRQKITIHPEINSYIVSSFM
jgi:hypothetical protein